MADLIQNEGREFHGAPPPGSLVNFPVNADTIVYEGAALMHNASNGAAQNCTPTASAEFMGFAIELTENRDGSLNGGALAAATVRVQTHGMVWLDVTKGSAFARLDAGTNVYASDSDTFTTSAGTNNVLIGRIVMVPEETVGANAGRVLVHFQNTAVRSI